LTVQRWKAFEDLVLCKYDKFRA